VKEHPTPLSCRGGPQRHLPKARDKREDRLPLQGPRGTATAPGVQEAGERPGPVRALPGEALERGLPQRQEALPREIRERGYANSEEICARFTAQLEERTRLAREIHDTLAQGLTGIVTQLEAARRVGISRQALNVVEAGHAVPSTAVALKLARALGCTVEDLFWLDDPGGHIVAELAEPRSGDEPTWRNPGRARVALAEVSGRWV